MLSARARALVAALALSVACTTTTTATRVAKLTLVSDPAGAEVTMVQGTGEVPLGRTPVVAGLPYTVEKRQFDPWCWAWPAYFGAGVLLGGVVGAAALASGPGSPGSGEAALGGLAVLVTAGPPALATSIYCGVSAARAGEQVEPRPYDLWVRAPGHRPVRIHHVAPRDGVLELRLTPGAGP